LTARAARRVVVAVVSILAVTDIVLAAALHHRGRTGSIGPLRVAEALGGPRYMLLVAGVALLVTVPSLRAAKRNAWRLALVLSAASAIGHHFNGMDLVGLAASVLSCAVLAASAGRFPVPPDPVRARRGWLLLALGETIVLVYGIGGLLLLDAAFRRSPSTLDAVTDALRLLLLLPAASVEPATRHGMWFVDSVRFLSLAVVLAGLAGVLRAAVVGPGRREADRRRVERLLDRWATAPLAPFHLLDDKTWFFSSDGDAFLSYKLVGRVAVVLGGPVGAPLSRELVVGEFLDRCHLNGWVPAFHQVDEADGPLLEKHGLNLLKIGEEALVPLDAFSLDGHGRKAMRSAVRRVERAGHWVEELAAPIDDETMAELRAVSDAWLASGGHRERTFTVGRFDPDELQATQVLVVRDRGDRIAAFVNVLPAYNADIGNFDLMRRRPDAVNGVMEFLLVALVERFRREGKRAMTLGLAPLANIEGDSMTARVLRLLRAYGGVAFSFGGLTQFKSRWGPEWEARYLAYPSPLDLPRIGVAVGRAGELPDESTVGSRALALVRRFPFSTAVIGLELWLMAVTSIDPALERFLLRTFGASWPSVAHLEWWRLATATIIEPRAGFVWSNLLLVGLVPLAEWRLRSRRAVAGFFLGDWLSTVPILAALRILGALGSGPALAAALSHDAGPSSGAYALLATLAVTVRARRPRALALAVVFGSVGVPLVVYTRLFDLQHLVAAGVGTALGSTWAAAATRRRERGGRRQPAPEERTSLTRGKRAVAHSLPPGPTT
jgi:lysylphosphatidylglycerol synthetase-like protein (DUF2156 family)